MAICEGAPYILAIIMITIYVIVAACPEGNPGRPSADPATLIQSQLRAPEGRNNQGYFPVYGRVSCFISFTIALTKIAPSAMSQCPITTKSGIARHGISDIISHIFT